MRKASKSGSKVTKSLLASALAGCSEEKARKLLWETAESLHMDPTELLGLDVDRKPPRAH